MLRDETLRQRLRHQRNLDHRPAHRRALLVVAVNHGDVTDVGDVVDVGDVRRLRVSLPLAVGVNSRVALERELGVEAFGAVRALEGARRFVDGLHVFTLH